MLRVERILIYQEARNSESWEPRILKIFHALGEGATTSIDTHTDHKLIGVHHWRLVVFHTHSADKSELRSGSIKLNKRTHCSGCGVRLSFLLKPAAPIIITSPVHLEPAWALRNDAKDQMDSSDLPSPHPCRLLEACHWTGGRGYGPPGQLWYLCRASLSSNTGNSKEISELLHERKTKPIYWNSEDTTRST
jgi:hypothetical protein